jgi:hypothetical protein
VVAVPPETMMRSVDNELDKLWGPLNPPVFGPNVDASLNNSANQNETTISIYPGDNQRVIASANDYRANLKPWVYLSTNGGTNWTNYQVPGTSNLFYGDPAMAFGPDHNKAYFSYLGYTSICSPMGGMYVSRSDDAGSTFTPPTLLLANTTDGQVVHFQDKEYVAVDKRAGSPNYRNAYIAWTSFVLNTGCSTQFEAPVILSRSTDEGISWSVPISVSPVISNNNQGVVPATGNNGEVYVYYVGAATQSQLNYDSVLFSRSTDGGQTFPFFTRISNMVDIPSPLPGTAFRDNGFGAMAVDRVMNGYLYAVWADYRNGDADILLSRSTDNGTTWGPPQRVNDDPLGNGKDQYFPWIASSDDGLVHISWHDEREDPNGAQYKAYYTYSSDHGATWGTNIAVSTAPSNPGSSTFIGDYSGIDAVTGVVMPVWTDIRAGTNQNAYTARGVKSVQATVTPVQTPPTATRTVTPAFPTPTFTPTPPPSCGLYWRLQPSPNGQTSHNYLSDVDIVSANDVWAVGYYLSFPSSAPQTLTMHYTNGQWQIVPSPNVGTDHNYLYGVAAVSADDVWAVGYYQFSASDYRTLIMHYTGGQWQVVSSPNVGTQNVLNAVTAISSDDLWAVGYAFDVASSADQTLTLHYTGGQWQVVTSPNVGTSPSRLFAVTAVSPGDVWAVGDYWSATEHTLTLHYTGGQWQVVTSPDVGASDNTLYGVSAVSANDVWAVGYYHASNANQTLTLHYTGGQWQVVTSPNVGPDSNYLYGVEAVPAGDVWAVGTSHNNSKTLTLHYTGGQWQVVTSPSRSITVNWLTGVAALSSTEVWAVGHDWNGTGSQATLTLHYSDPCSTPTPVTSTPTGTPTPTVAVSVTSTHGTFCPVTSTGASTSCTAPSSYDYSFQFNGTCTIGGDATLRFEVALSSSGPWTIFDTQTFRANFHNGANTLTGSLTETAIPSQYTWYRITIAILMDDDLTTYNATSATPICSTGDGTPTSTPTACTITFTDVDENNVFYSFIRCLACRGIIGGYDDGTFRPFNDITRGQIAKIVSNAAGFDEDPGPQIYEDVPVGSPFYSWINRLSNRGHIGGYPCGLLPEEPCIEPGNLPYFRPSNSATRGQLAKIVANAAGLDTTPTGVFYTDVQEDHPFYIWIMRLTQLGVMSGYDCGGDAEPCDNQNRPYFRPYNNVTRGQASKIVANTFYPGCETPARRRYEP